MEVEKCPICGFVAHFVSSDDTNISLTFICERCKHLFYINKS